MQDVWTVDPIVVATGLVCQEELQAFSSPSSEADVQGLLLSLAQAQEQTKICGGFASSVGREGEV